MANEIVWAPDTTAVAALDTDDVSLALLPDATGFDWKAIDSTGAASFDPNRHVVVEGDKPLATGAWYRRLPGDQPQLRDFGAKGDGDFFLGDLVNGGMTLGQPTLIIQDTRFLPSDVGLAIVVEGVGAGGAPLASTIVGYTNETTVTLAHSALTADANQRVYWRGGAMTAGQTTLVASAPRFVPGDVGKIITVSDAAVLGTALVSSIVGYTSPTTVTLADAAPVTVSGATVYWGTDDTAAIQDAINFMASYDVRSRALYVPRGSFTFTKLIIPEEILGVSLNGESYWDSNLVCMTAGAEPAIWNYSQEFKMFDLSLISGSKSRENWTNGKIGLRNDKDYKKTDNPLKFADVDSVVNRCRISGFSRAIYHKGRSLVMRGFNHIATCDWGIQFEWPDEDSYQPNEFGPGSDYLGFRGNIIEGLRVHAPRNGAILNDGKNAHKAWGLKLDNIILDIGRCIFKGHLGVGGMLTNSMSMMTDAPAVVLTGGSNFTVANINAVGARPPGQTPYTPVELIRLEAGTYSADGTTGVYRAGTFSNVQLAASQRRGVLVAANTELLGVKFNDFTFDSIGTNAPASHSAFEFESTNSSVEVNRPLVIGTASNRSFVNNTQASNVIHLNDPRRAGGNATPFASGTTSSIVIDNHYRYTPVLTNSPSVTASTVSVCDYVYLSADLIQVSGRCTALPTAAGNCVMQIALPVPSAFTDASQASGSFIGATAGSNIAGAVLANTTGATFEVRWAAPNTTNRSFSFLATYRVI